MITRETISSAAIKLADSMGNAINELNARGGVNHQAVSAITRMSSNYSDLESLCRAYNGNYRDISVLIDGQYVTISNLMTGVYLFSLEVEKQMNYRIGLKMFY